MSNVIDLGSPAFKANPFPTYARLRAEGPIKRIPFPDGKPAWLILRYADVAPSLKDTRLAKNPRRALSPADQARNVPWTPGFLQPIANNMLDQDAPDHTRLRGLVHKAFTLRTVEQLRPRIEAMCDELIAAARARGAIDLVADFALPMPFFVISEMLGIPERDRPRFRALAARIVTVLTPFDMLLASPSMWMLLRFLRKLIRERKGSGGDDLLAALHRAEESGDRLSEDELLSMVFLLLIAGHETTVNLIASGTLALLDRPGSIERLRAEPALIPSAVEELLRYTSPIELATERYTTTDIAFGGHVIPRGERVFAAIGSANHDEQTFESPEELRLDREPNRHLAFGGGAHYCVGAPLARLEAQIALATLVREVPGLRFAVPREKVRWKRNAIIRGVAALPVSLPQKRGFAASGPAAQPSAGLP